MFERRVRTNLSLLKPELNTSHNYEDSTVGIRRVQVIEYRNGKERWNVGRIESRDGRVLYKVNKASLHFRDELGLDVLRTVAKAMLTQIDYGRSFCLYLRAKVLQRCLINTVDGSKTS
ncbi:hypothetical protein J6590_039421 [Homalodisca vitripennis]|nr:hypothetical protein J6590_039421 [Homalodisca vitripennis]